MNPWTKFSGLVAPSAKSIVTVIAVGTNGDVTVELSSGAIIKVAGSGVSVGNKVIIQSEKIIGKAPALPIVNTVV